MKKIQIIKRIQDKIEELYKEIENSKLTQGNDDGLKNQCRLETISILKELLC